MLITGASTGIGAETARQAVARGWRVALGARAQAAAADSGRPVSKVRDVVVLRTGAEARIALVGPGGVERAWRVHSSTPLGEIQLAEPYADGVVLVIRS